MSLDVLIVGLENVVSQGGFSIFIDFTILCLPSNPSSLDVIGSNKSQGLFWEITIVHEMVGDSTESS